MALARFGRQVKRPYGVCFKMTAVAVMGMCFLFFWSMFSASPSAVTSQRSSFGDISKPMPGSVQVGSSASGSKKDEPEKTELSGESNKVKFESDLEEKDEKKFDGSVTLAANGHNSANIPKKEEASEGKNGIDAKNHGSEGSDNKESEKEKEEEEVEGDEQGEAADREGETNEDAEDDGDWAVTVEEEPVTRVRDGNGGKKSTGKKIKIKGPLFDSKGQYTWKLCSTRSKHNYIPCIDNESGIGRLQNYRHKERRCPRTSPMCLVPLPASGYSSPVPWPESKLKVLYKNVAHPKLTAFIKAHSWLVESGEYIMFPQNQSEFKGGVSHYLESIEEMVPDIEWGTNVRVVLDVGCKDVSFGAFLLDKEVLTLSLGLNNDLVDLAQVALERGFPAVVSPFLTRRLPFPSGVFDAIHCGGCNMAWHSDGGKLLLEMNRILRPGGYFILSSKQDNIEEEEGVTSIPLLASSLGDHKEKMTTLTASICWNILAHKTDEISELGVKIYQKPESNHIYELRRKKVPPICKEDEKPDAAWYVPMTTCLHTIPAAIEERGTEWPQEWPKRLDSFPDWLENRDKLIADTEHWKAIVNKSYLAGMGIDWLNVHNILDMKSIYGGFAAALSGLKVWVMNVVPVHAPDTLPIIYERGLVGIYHDWCESFGTYPRSYDLLHADHMFSRLKNRCKQPVAIVVEMDRILRPGGWAIIRDKVEILDPLEGILRSMHWEIRMTFAQGKEGIMCAQKTLWRP